MIVEGLRSDRGGHRRALPGGGDLNEYLKPGNRLRIIGARGTAKVGLGVDLDKVKRRG